MSRDPSEDTVHAVLSGADRRRVIRRLATADGPVAVEELVALVSADGGAARVRFHHVVLPKLVDSGVVDHDPASRQVWLTPAGERVAAVHRATTDLLDGG